MKKLLLVLVALVSFTSAQAQSIGKAPEMNMLQKASADSGIHLLLNEKDQGANRNSCTNSCRVQFFVCNYNGIFNFPLAYCQWEFERCIERCFGG
jgi:hypothetical protein